MSYDQILTGSVIRYPYLWARQARDGEVAGRKARRLWSAFVRRVRTAT